MAKDGKARHRNRITVMALANMIAAIVDTMREADVPNGIVHGFLDNLERMNVLTLSGQPGMLMAEFVEIVRATVPSND